MLLKAVNIHKIYNGVPLISNINLQIDDQDRIGLIGANGCGKSTLLKILLGQVLPDRETEEEGLIIRGSKTSVGYLAQSAALDSEKTVWEEMRSVFSALSKFLALPLRSARFATSLTERRQISVLPSRSSKPGKEARAVEER